MANRSTSREVAAGRARTGASVVDELGDWSVGPGPGYRRLAGALRDLMERGTLPPGARLPSERALSTRLGVSRGMVVAAFDELLGEGAVERRHGSGTYVRGDGLGALPADREGTGLVRRLAERSAQDGADGATASARHDLSLSVVHDLGDLDLPVLSVDDLRTVEPETGYTPWGLGQLRRAIARHVTGWGLPTATEQIVVTTGAQQAIAACAASWLRPGDTVVLDAPTYPGAIATFRQAGARLVGVPVDRHGPNLAALEAALRARPALVYVQSGVHSPTGAILSDRRRRDVAALVTAHRVPLVEDAALADVAWAPVPWPIAAHGPEDAPIALVGSLSKLFWGGLRIGFVRVPTALAPRFARIKATLDLGSSAPSQLLAHALLTDRGFERFLAGRRVELRRRCTALEAALRQTFPAWRWATPRGGLSLWVRVPGADGDQLARRAAAAGVGVAPPGPLLPDRATEARFADHVRLSFSAPVPDLEAAVQRLGAALA